MARNNMRALQLGPTRVGWFAWTSLLDQRLSMWTSLVGPTTMVVLSFLHQRNYVPYYLAWVVMSRGLICLLYYITTGRFHPLFPLVLYYNQVVGAGVKIFMIFHQDRQKWTRQTLLATAGAGVRFGTMTSGWFMAVSIGLFALGIALLAGILQYGERPIPAQGLWALFH